MKIKSSVIICGREFSIETDPKSEGAQFNTHGKTGRGIITIGTKRQDPEYILGMLLHEIVEATLCEDNKRFTCGDGEDLFVFNHHYLSGFIWKLLRGMVSCNMVKQPQNVQISGRAGA